MSDYVADSISTELRRFYNGHTLASASREAHTLISEKSDRLGGMAALVSGKTLIAKLSAWSRAEFDVGFGLNTLAAEMTIGEVADEVRDVLTAIEKGTSFPPLRPGR